MSHPWCSLCQALVVGCFHVKAMRHRRVLVAAADAGDSERWATQAHCLLVQEGKVGGWLAGAGVRMHLV